MPPLAISRDRHRRFVFQPQLARTRQIERAARRAVAADLDEARAHRADGIEILLDARDLGLVAAAPRPRARHWARRSAGPPWRRAALRRHGRRRGLGARLRPRLDRGGRGRGHLGAARLAARAAPARPVRSAWRRWHSGLRRSVVMAPLPKFWGRRNNGSVRRTPRDNVWTRWGYFMAFRYGRVANGFAAPRVRGGNRAARVVDDQARGRPRPVPAWRCGRSSRRSCCPQRSRLMPWLTMIATPWHAVQA